MSSFLSEGAATVAEVTADQQAMWEALLVLGIDGDGDPTPGALIAGMGADGFRAMFLRDVRQARKDHDDATDEVCMDPDAHEFVPFSEYIGFGPRP